MGENKLSLKLEIATCPSCKSINLTKQGQRNGMQRYKCKICGKSFLFGEYIPKKKSTLNKNIDYSNKFVLEEYKNNLKSINKKTANFTAKQIAKYEEKFIKEELTNYIFKENDETDYGIIKILVNTNNWGIQTLLDLVFNNDNTYLTSFNINTICEELVSNLKYSWKYIKSYLYKYYNLKINKNIEPDNFVKTHNKYENYQFIISRFFYKLSNENTIFIDKYIGKYYIEELFNQKYYKKFLPIKFDNSFFYIDSKVTELEYSLNKIIEKFNQKNTVITSQLYNEKSTYISLGNEYEKIIAKIIIENDNTAKRHTQFDDDTISDLYIENNKKIIECKLFAKDREIVGTIIKYARYCNELEIWSLANIPEVLFQNQSKIFEINLNDFYKFLIDSRYENMDKTNYKSYIDTETFNKNIIIKLKYFNDILKELQNDVQINEIRELEKKYLKLGYKKHISNKMILLLKELSKISKIKPKELRISYEDYLIPHSYEIQNESNRLCIYKNSKSIFKYNHKSENDNDWNQSWYMYGEITIISLKKLIIPKEFFNYERKKDFFCLELKIRYKNLNSFPNFETIFDNMYLVDKDSNKYDKINNYELDNLMNMQNRFVQRHFPTASPNQSISINLYFLINNSSNTKLLFLEKENTSLCITCSNNKLETVSNNYNANNISPNPISNININSSNDTFFNNINSSENIIDNTNLSDKKNNSSTKF